MSKQIDILLRELDVKINIAGSVLQFLALSSFGKSSSPYWRL